MATREQNEQKRLEILKEDVRNAFEADSVSDEFVRAYEETARQKLIDFADYMKITSDTSLDKNFRQQAGIMASRLFISGSVNIAGWSRIYSIPGLSTPDQLREKILSLGMIYWVQPFQIEINKPLTRLNDSVMAGSLSFYQSKIPFNNQLPADTNNKVLLIDIYNVKKVKIFDKEQLRIWEVLLGDVE